LGMALDELRDADKELKINEIDVIINSQEYDSVINSVVDFESSFMGKGFVVKSGDGGSC
jgi:Fe-S cluster assembly iron-binding protein IscA